MRRIAVASVWVLACEGASPGDTDDGSGTLGPSTTPTAESGATPSTTDATSTSDGTETTGPSDGSSESTAAPGCPDGDPECIEIELHQVLELGFTATDAIADPFDTYLLRLEVTDPAGDVREVDGYYDGDGTRWRARLTCDAVGLWQWATIAGDAPNPGLVGLSGAYACVPGPDLGGLVVAGRGFALASGDPLYLVGNFLDFTLQSTHVYMSEDLGGRQRAAILDRQQSFHRANKINVYFANVGDYGGDSVTPWPGDAGASDKSQMDLSRWALYDRYIRDIKGASMLAELWFFADDSAFGDQEGFALEDHMRLLRYAMARTSAFSHTLYVIALEWQEGFSAERIDALGELLAARDPWRRPLSVHALTGTDWAFAGSSWPSFVATQAGNDASSADVNAYGISIRGQTTLPHLDEEFGILEMESDVALRQKLWANLASGAAGGGTGSDLAAMQSFLHDSRMPYARMEPHNELISDGGNARYCLAEVGRHYLVYTTSGGFDVQLEGEGLQASWYDPRDPDAVATDTAPVEAGTASFTPPTADDWVLWVSDGSDLASGVTHPTAGVEVTVIEL